MNMHIARIAGTAPLKWIPGLWVPPANDARHVIVNESHEARAERSLAHLEAVLETRRRWRHRLRVVTWLALPIVMTLMARQARGAFV